MLQPHITFENDENQGLIFNLDYNKGLSKYLTNLKSKSYNITTNSPRNLRRSNIATASIINAFGINGEFETLPSLVSNSEDVFQETRYAYPKWRDTDSTIRSIYIQKALGERAKEQGRNLYGITMRFSPKLAQQVMEHGAGFMQSRLSLQLKRSLDYSPDMWLHLEAVVSKKQDKQHIYKIDGKGSISHSHGLLHMHGAISLRRSDLDAVKRVIRKINKSTSTVFKNHELRLKKIYDGLGWVDYCHKNRRENLIFLNGVERYSRTKALGSVAQELYEADRQRHKAAYGTTYGKGK